MLDDEYFRQLAGGLGHEWRKLATLLGIGRDAIDRMEEDYHRTEERIFQVLVSWRRNSDWRKDTVTQLKEALTKCSRQDLADQLEEVCLSVGFSHSVTLSELTDSDSGTDEGPTGELPTHCLETKDCKHTNGVPALTAMRAEFHRRFAHLRGMERLGSTCRLVDFVAGYFDFYGGTLILPEYDVLLYIPQGAIPSGKVQEVYLYVKPMVQSVSGLRSRAVLSPLVECGPSGLRFMKSVVLHLPHFATDGGQGWDMAAGVCYSEEEETHSGDWSNLVPDENSNVIINKQQIILALDHFSRYAVFGAPSSEGCGKTLKAWLSPPVCHPTTGYCQVHVLIWNDANISRQCVIRSQENLPFGALDEACSLAVTWGAGDLMLRLKNVQPGFKVGSAERCITEEMLWGNQMHSVTFDLQVDSASYRGAMQIEPDGDSLCDVEVCQSNVDWSASCVRLPQYHAQFDKPGVSGVGKHVQQRERTPTRTDGKSRRKRKQVSDSPAKEMTTSTADDRIVPHGGWKLSLDFGVGGRVDTTTRLLRSIAAYKTGEVVIADFGNNRVMISDSRGFVKDDIPLERVWDVAVLPNNYLVIVDETSHVKVFSEKREPAFRFTTIPAEMIGQKQVGLVSAAIGTNGNIFIGDVSTNVVTEHLPTDGALLRTRQLTICPHFLAVNSKGHLLVSGWNVCKVDIMDEGNAVVGSVHPSIKGKPAWCLGVCCDSKDDIFIVVTSSDDTVGHVHRYGAQGDFKQCVVEGLHQPRGVVCVDDTKLAVANTDMVLLFERYDS